jgi:chemotaxis response regulator CheB
MTPPGTVRDPVVVGASAGGVEALRSLAARILRDRLTAGESEVVSEGGGAR